MAVRNSYIQATVDGRKTQVTGGPRSKDGGMEVTISQRHKGEIAEVVVYRQYANPDGTIVAKVTLLNPNTGEIEAQHMIYTQRDE